MILDAVGTSTHILLPDARPVPFGVTDSRRKTYSIVITPHVHFQYYVILYISR
jgi:hypothetical protein